MKSYYTFSIVIYSILLWIIMNHVPVLFRVKSHILSSACLSRPPRFVRLPQGPRGAACQCWSYGVSAGVCHRWSSGVRVACRYTNLYCQFHRRPMSHHLSPRRITLALTLVQKPICIVLAKEEARIIIIISVGNNKICVWKKNVGKLTLKY